LACSICETRKDKRFCLAVHGRICPECCGKEREVSLDCPGDCLYLQQARRYESSREVDLQARMSEALPEVEVSESILERHKNLYFAVMEALFLAVRRERSLSDRDIIGTLSGIATSYQTRINSGLVYQAPSTSLVQQELTRSIQDAIAEYRKGEQREVGYSSVRDSEVLQLLVIMLRFALARANGRPRSRAFVDHLAAAFKDGPRGVAPPDAESSLILP
jgi:hypothetical protein